MTRTQLLRAGLGSDAIKYRLQRGRLRAVQQGVYQVGPLAASHAREIAAVLACGPETFVSHRSAAALWRILAPPGDSVPVEVTVRKRHRRRRPGVRVHCSPDLAPDEAGTVDGIPVTTPARTVIDLASAVGSRKLEQALARSEREGLTSHSELSSLIARHPRRRGVGGLRALLQDRVEPALTRSEAEERFLSLITKAQLPRPEANVEVGGYEVDFLWRAERLVVEVDGFGFHGSHAKFESDRRRDGWLSARGVQVIRVTWRQIVREPEAMLVRLAQALVAVALR